MAREKKPNGSDDPQTLDERRAFMTWAQRLKGAFNIDIETCHSENKLNDQPGRK
jgi:hypothetical protein